MTSITFAADQTSNYSPPFELYGIVNEVSDDCLQVFVPKIDKIVEVAVSPQTIILNRMDNTDTSHNLQEIQPKDLVIINGVVNNEAFFSQEISFLPVD
ncbi:MAG: hypothetical protein GY853_11895 [PVC group bacterium]|nr:hypothetical protein [PVC group bacterium]